MIDRVLVPVDGSDCARTAAEHAFALADCCDAAVDLLGVLEGDRTVRGTDPDAAAESPETRARAMLDDVAALGPADAPVETHVRTGRPHDEILAAASERDADGIAMGRHGRTGLGERLLGSVTDKVLREADRPVLTATDRAADAGFERLLVPTDGSDLAALAAGPAATIAAGADAAVDVVTVVDVQAQAGVFDAGGVSEEYVERLRARSRESVAELADRIRTEGLDLDPETAVLEGRPHEEIGAYVDDHDVDLVVMGTHGQSGFTRRLLGSVATRVLRTVDVPVLAVPGAE